MGELKNLFEKSKSAEQYIIHYFEYLNSIAKKTDKKSIAALIALFLDAGKKGSTIFFIGNGGSASTASHFAADLAKNASSGKNKFKAVSLTDNVAMMTALANDNGYDNIFADQLAILLKKGDVVVGLSASGNSKNILKAIKYANENGAITFGITGFDGGQLKKEAKHCVHIPSYKGEYGPVEDVHLMIDHIVTSYFYFSENKE